MVELTKDKPQSCQLNRGARATNVPVLHIMNEVGDSSIKNMVSDQLEHFGCRGFDWHVAGLDGVDGNEPFESLGARVVDFSRHSRGSGKLKLVNAIRRYVHDHNIQVVHAHNPRSTVMAFLAMGSRGTKKLIATKHLHVLAQERPKWGWLYAAVDRVSSYLPDHIVAVSQDVGLRVVSQPGISQRCVSVIQNAVKPEQYFVPQERDAVRQEFGIAEDAVVLGFAGRIARQKRLDLLLRAFAEIRDSQPAVWLLLAGEGEEREFLNTLTEEFGVAQNVIWTGHRQDMPRIMAAMDIYVQSSVNEGLSLSLLQAMSARKAIVATDVGGTREVINGDTGLLIEPGSSSAITKAVLTLIEDSAEADRLIDNARQLIETEFNVVNQMKKYKQVYRSIGVYN